MGAKGIDVFILVLIHCGFIFTMFQVASVSSTEDHNYGVRVMKADVVKKNNSDELHLDNDAAGRKLWGFEGLFEAIGQSRNAFKEFKSGDLPAAKDVTNSEDTNYFLNMFKQKCKAPRYASCCVTMAGTFACSRYCCFDKYGKKVCKIIEFTNGNGNDDDTEDGADQTCPTSLNGVTGVDPTSSNGATGVDPTSSNGATGVDPTSSNGTTGVDPTSSNGANSGSTGVVSNGSGLKNIASVYVLSSISLCYFIYILLLS